MITSESSIPTLAFTSNFQQYLIGDLQPGASARIAYDSNRLTGERSSYNGSPTWSITAFYRFAPDGPIQQARLQFQTAGMVPGPEQSVTNGATFMFAVIDVPADAQSVEMWFLNTGRSSQQFWDSDYGRNYVFRFAANDLGTALAYVVSSWPTPYSRLDVQLNAVDLAVTSVAVNYRVTNIESDSPYIDGYTYELSKLTEERGRAVWSGSQTVPYRAEVLFTITYTVDGRTYVGLNGGRGYTSVSEPTVSVTDGAEATAPPPQAPAPVIQP